MRIISWLLLILIAVGFGFFLAIRGNPSDIPEEEYIEKVLAQKGYPPLTPPGKIFTPQEGKVYLPIKNFYRNQTVKTFGVFISDRFTGFHSGVDIEVDKEDLNKEVPVYATYDGRVEVARFAAGYGGVVAIRHNFGDISVLGAYGHLRLKDFKVRVGDVVKSGQLIGYLGAGLSPETDGERKHLHFGLYRGGDIDISGYVGTAEELKNWLNPTTFLCQLDATDVGR